MISDKPLMKTTQNRVKAEKTESIYEEIAPHSPSIPADVEEKIAEGVAVPAAGIDKAVAGSNKTGNDDQSH